MFAFLQFAHYCSPPPVIITRRCRGVKDELTWGPVMYLIDSWLDPTSGVQISLHQQIKENGWDLYVFVEMREICSFAILFLYNNITKLTESPHYDV